MTITSEWLKRAGIAAAGAFCVIAQPARAADDADTVSQAEVIDGFNFRNIDGLEFSTIVPSGAGGTVTINASTGAVTTLGNVATVGNGQHRALFRSDAPVGIILIYSGDPSVTLTRVSGTETMNALLFYSAGSGLLPSFVLGLPIGFQATLGSQDLYVGGQLSVAGNQAPGQYEGTFSVQAVYL